MLPHQVYFPHGILFDAKWKTLKYYGTTLLESFRIFIDKKNLKIFKICIGKKSEAKKTGLQKRAWRFQLGRRLNQRRPKEPKRIS